VNARVRYSRCSWHVCVIVSVGLQSGNGYGLLGAPDGESHGEGVRERGE